MMSEACPCGRTESPGSLAVRSFSQCCGPFLSHSAHAKTPEELMRSRYSAFAMKDFSYIIETTLPEQLALLDQESNQNWMNQATFTKLEVLRFSSTGDNGVVEFKAHFLVQGKPHIHHETSQFRFMQNRWYYCLS